VGGRVNGAVTLRPVGPDDGPFLLDLYASTRAEELAQVPWTDEQKVAFCRMQFAAQHQHYQEHYAGARWDVIELEGAPIGRLYVARWVDEIRIIDIALLPGFRGRGVGSTLLKQVLAEGQAAGKPVSIHVEQFNAALGLYKRLGFEVVEERGAYWFLRWTAGQRTSKPGS
jgi:ribosomal protein S18 acetylase RimI-like enzyme